MEGHSELGSSGLDNALKGLQALAKEASSFVNAVGNIRRVAHKGMNVAIYAAGELARAKKLMADLRRWSLPDLLSQANEGLAVIEQQAAATANREVQRLLSGLSDRLASIGFALSGHYPELSCDVFTISFDATAKGMEVSVFYGPRIARLAVVTGGEVDKIVEAVKRSAEELQRSLIPQDQALPFIFKAWKMAAFRAGTTDEEARIPILNVLAELCFLRQSEKFLRNPVRSTFTPYGQVSFAHQLFTLAQRRHENKELVLGVATREDVKNRKSLWVPRNRKGEGVHYSTVTFRKVE